MLRRPINEHNVSSKKEFKMFEIRLQVRRKIFNQYITFFFSISVNKSAEKILVDISLLFRSKLAWHGTTRRRRIVRKKSQNGVPTIMAIRAI